MSRQRLCRLSDIRDGEAKGFTVETAASQRDILVHRDGGTVRGYVNSCPHIGSPLDWAPGCFIALDGFHLLYGTHGALFRPQDGYPPPSGTGAHLRLSRPDPHRHGPAAAST